MHICYRIKGSTGKKGEGYQTLHLGEQSSAATPQTLKEKITVKITQSSKICLMHSSRQETVNQYFQNSLLGD